VSTLHSHSKKLFSAFSEYDMIYLLIAIGLSPGGSCTVHIYTQAIHRATQNKQYIELHTNFGRVRDVSCTLAFASQLRKRHGRTSVRICDKLEV
jgi:hypothetical protein